MKIKILGAHNTESLHTKMTCLLVDDILALDAGALTSSLSFRSQLKVKAILLTHAHYDHLRDIPAFFMNLYLRGRSATICTHQAVIDNLIRYFLNGVTYPEFHKRPAENPTLKFRILEPDDAVEIEGYRITPFPVTHALPAMGYQISSRDGLTIFYTGDTGANLAAIWQQISPQCLIIEVTGPNRWEKSMHNSGHLTPHLLEKELLSFQQIKGYFPQVILVHLNPADESEIIAEIDSVQKSLGASIIIAREGMRIQLEK